MSNDPLDLADIDPPIWRVLVEGEVYGPFTLGQLRSFILEDRVTIDSSIAYGDGGAFILAGDEPRLTKIFEQHHARKRAASEAAPANHVVVTRAASESRDRIISVLNEVGEFIEVLPGVYLINTTMRTAKLHERLGSVAGDRDRILIVNASKDRLAWLGLGPEADTHIRTIWKPKS